MEFRFEEYTYGLVNNSDQHRKNSFWIINLQTFALAKTEDFQISLKETGIDAKVFGTLMRSSQIQFATEDDLTMFIMHYGI